MRELVTAASDKAVAILHKHRQQLDEGAKLLLEEESLTREELPLLDDLRLPLRPSHSLRPPEAICEMLGLERSRACR